MPLTPTASSYVSQYVPIPEAVGASIGQYVQNQLAAETQVEAQQDLLATAQTELGSQMLNRDNGYAQNMFTNVRQELDQVAGYDSMAQLRATRGLARRFATQAGPVAQRYKRRAELVAAIPQDYDPQDRAAAEAAIDAQFQDLTPEAIQAGNHMPDPQAGQFAARTDLLQFSGSIAQAVREEVDQGSLQTSDMPGFNSQTTITQVAEDKIRRTVERGLRDRSTPSGSWAYQFAQFEAQRKGTTPEAEMNTLVSTHQSQAVDLFARSRTDTNYSGDGISNADPRSTGGSGDDATMPLLSNGFQTINWGATNMTAAELDAAIDSPGIEARYNRSHPVPSATGVDSALAARIRQNPQAYITSVGAGSSNNGPNRNAGSPAALRYAWEVKQHQIGLNEELGRARTTRTTGNNANWNHETIQISGDSDANAALDGDFTRAQGRMGSYRVYMQDGSGVRRLTDASDMQGYRITNRGLMTPDSTGRMFIEYTTQNEDGDTRMFLVSGADANTTSSWASSYLLQNSIPGSSQQQFGALLALEQRIPGTGPVTALAGLNPPRNGRSTSRSVPGFPGFRMERFADQGGQPQYVIGTDDWTWWNTRMKAATTESQQRSLRAEEPVAERPKRFSSLAAAYSFLGERIPAQQQ